MRHPRIRSALAALATLTVGALALSGCAAGAVDAERPAASAQDAAAVERIAISYDGGIAVLDAATLESVAELPLDGFLRLNAAGDDRHLLISGEGGFRVLDAGTAGSDPELTDAVFPAEEPGHVVRHDGHTVLFDDGTGDITIFDPAQLGAEGGALPEVETIASEQAHHGVAIRLSDGSLVSTLGDSESRRGLRVLDADGHETARDESCPGVHGEGALDGEVVVAGCEDGALIVRDGAITKVASPTEFGRIGNFFTVEGSAIAVGDYNPVPDAEGYVLHDLALIDTDSGTLQRVELPAGVGYTFRDLGRGPQGEALVLSTDGSLYSFDAETGAQLSATPVIDAWEGPAEWQDAHPALLVRGGVAYVTEPATASVHAVDLATGEVIATATLPGAPIELALT